MQRSNKQGMPRGVILMTRSNKRSMPRRLLFLTTPAFLYHILFAAIHWGHGCKWGCLDRFEDVFTCQVYFTGPRSAVGNVSDFRSRGRELDPGLVPYFRGD